MQSNFIKKKFSFIVVLLAVLSLTACNFNSSSSTSIFNTSSTSSFVDKPSITINNGNEIDLLVGQKVQLDVTLNRITGTIKYRSLNENVCTIDDNGLISAVSEGRTTVIASVGGYSDSIAINVSENKSPIVNIITPSPFQIYQYNLKLIEYEVLNYDGSVDVSSSHPDIVSVDEVYSNMIAVSGLKIGSSTITVSLESGESDSIVVNVVEESIETLSISFLDDEIIVGSFTSLNVKIEPASFINRVSYNVLSGSDLIEFEGDSIYAIGSGEVQIQAECDGLKSNIATLNIYDFEIKVDDSVINVGDHERIRDSFYQGQLKNLKANIEDENIISVTFAQTVVDAFYVDALSVGTTSFYLYDDNGLISNTLEIEVIDGNPYENVDKEEFYNDYTRANSYTDAMFRSEYYLMSGSIALQDQEPTIAKNQPKASDGKLIHNSKTHYSNYGNTYTVYDSNGEEAFQVYYGAAYVSLEEVAAYIYAWGDVPINYNEGKSASPALSPWGEYLRLNNSKFSGDVDSYPYEPVLPDISGCGGNLIYYEIDIGTTGTDCDPNYTPAIYNDGYYITRGAARIVYSRYYEDTGEPVNSYDRYVFYTYNHYNDFQEYLNYENGWGEMFGNITGGGVISSKNPNLCNPTPYVETVRMDLF